MNKVIDLKGSILSLSVLRLYDSRFEETKRALDEKVATAPDFFVGIPVVLEPQVALSDATFLAQLVEYLHQLQMIPIGVRTNDDAILAQAEYAGLAVFQPTSRQSERKQAPAADKTESADAGLCSAMWVQGAVRSGQQVYAKDRDVIVTGSINPGAEVVADGHVHVFGSVMGKVFAGSGGYQSAKIFAHRLNPELVCIAGMYQLSEDIDDAYKQGFVEVRLQDDKLVFNPDCLN